MNPLREQIEELDPERFAETAHRVARIAAQLAEQAGMSVPESAIQLLELSKEEIAMRKAGQA